METNNTPHNDPSPDDLIGPTAAAKLLHINVATIYRAIIDGRLRAWRYRGTKNRRGGRKVSKAEVLALLRPEPVRRPVCLSPRQQTEAERAKEEAWLDAQAKKWGID